MTGPLTAPLDASPRERVLLFRVGREWFALPLAAAEEAVEGLDWEALPDMPVGLLGAARLRGRVLPVYDAAVALGAPRTDPYGVTVVLRRGTRAIGLQVDDVEDVLELADGDVRRTGVLEASDTLVRGVVHHGNDLVAVLHTDGVWQRCVGEGQ